MNGENDGIVRKWVGPVPVAQPTCSNCDHYSTEASALTLDAGQCRRYPPKVYVLPNFKTPLVAYVPMVAETPACGEFACHDTEPV
jgi:hypothetical protein